MDRFGIYALVAVTLLVGGCGSTDVHQDVGVRHTPSASNDAKAIQKQPGGVQSEAQSVGTVLPKKTIDHVVVVIEENRSYGQIIGNSLASYINELAGQGALFTASHGTGHPSQPNYIALFSGTNQGITSDSCPNSLTAPNLATALNAKGLTFGGYAEDMPSVGFQGCSWHRYARKHAPWVNFTNVPSRFQMPFSQFPSDFRLLPTVSFVIPNLDHDMHDGTVQQADQWLRQHLDSYVHWAKTHNSLLIVTWDEDDFSQRNRIPTMFVGPMIRKGTYGQNINHYNVLRTIEDMFWIKRLGNSAEVAPVANIWKGTFNEK